MDKIDSWILNRGGVTYDCEELSVLDLVGKTAVKTNELVDKVTTLEDSNNKKVSHDEMNSIYKHEGSDFKGSWHGIEKPQFAEPGMAGVVDNLVSQMEDIVNDVVNVKFHPLYDINDVSLALNDIITKLKEGDTVVLNEPVCKIRNTINGFIPANVTLDLNCKFEVIGNIDGFNLKGSWKPMFVKIKGIYGDENNYLNHTNSGFKLTSSFSANIEIGNIIGFFKGLNMCCEHDGIQYVRVATQNILTCKYGIVLDSKGFWVNENTFDCGMIGCSVGIKTFTPNNVNNHDCYNNNRFLHPAFEYIGEKCVDVTNFYYNSITDFRLMESYPTSGIIFNEVNSYANHYKCTHKVRASQFKIDFESTIEGMICSDTLVFLSDKAFSKYQALGECNKLAFRQFNQTVYIDLNTSNNLPNKTFEYTKAFDTVYYDVGYDHKFMRIPQVYNYEGFELNVYWESVGGETNGGLGLKVIDGDNTTQHWFSKGLTKVMFINGQWKFLKLKDVT